MKLNRKPKKEIKINTTALPDIIFMLLFFFMVTTVIQNKEIQEMELPNAENATASKPDLTALQIYLGNEEDLEFVKVNKIEGRVDQFSVLLEKELASVKNKGGYVEHAYLYIDQKMSMSTVNKVKRELQLADVLKVNYIHNIKLRG